MPEHNLWTLFDAVAAAVPDRECLVWRQTRRTFAETAERAQRFANVLTAAGLGLHTDRSSLESWQSGQDLVGLYLLNGPEYLEANLGGYAARTAPFNVNYRYVADELAYLLDDASAAALVYHARFAPTLGEVLDRLAAPPKLLVQVADSSGEALLPGALDYEDALAGADAILGTSGQDPDDLYVLYTGGTTGMPKGTLWRQADIWEAAIGAFNAQSSLEEIVAAAEASENRLLPNAPFMHGAAHWVALNTLLGGGTVVVNDTVDRLDPVEVWTTVQRERIMTMLLVGESFARPLLAELERGDYDASSLVLIASGGAVLSPESKDRLLELLPSVMVLDAAGASETGATLHSLSSKGSTAEGAAFQASPTFALLSDARDRKIDPGDDTEGWFAKSGAIPLGYLGDQAKTEATFPVVDGVRWSVPGDRARWLPDGNVQLLGRDSVTINTGGEKVFAEEVEQAVLLHPAVADAVVVGRSSERWGQEVVAIVQLDADATDEDILAVAAERVARYKLPKAIVRVPQVVRSPAGKADYRWAKITAGAEGER